MFLSRIFTLYPEYFPGYLNKGLFGKAMNEKIWNLETVNIRDYSIDKHKTVDDTPYGGGNGMLIKADVLAKSLDDNIKKKEKIIYLSPKGKLFNHQYAKELSSEKTINFICGHFEGIDERIIQSRDIEEVSIGDFILSGGEVATFVVLDAILRFLPGVLGNENSLSEESFSKSQIKYPVYTKPKNFRGMNVPEILLSGDHKKIDIWRSERSKLNTKLKRPDLI